MFTSVPLVFHPIDLTRVVTFKMDILCTGGFLRGAGGGGLYCIITNTRM